MANSTWQYEQPRCPDNWNESERRFYNRLVQVLDDIYAKYGRIDEKMLSTKVIDRIDNSPEQAFEKIAEGLSTGKIAADSIEATFAHIVTLTARFADFNFATVQNLIADALVVQKGQGDYVHITNFAATYGQMVNATIGNLIIKSSEGDYYQLDVGKNGTVSAKQVEGLSDEEVLAGAASDGRPIVGTQISAVTLDAETVAASLGLFNKITASMIDTDVLVARTAFIEALTSSNAFIELLTVTGSAFIEKLKTSKIVGDSSLEVILEKADKAMRFDEEGLHIGDKNWSSEALVRPGGFDLKVGDKRHSSFSTGYLLLGNMQVKVTDSGLAISAYNG